MQEWFVYYQVTHANGIIESKETIWIQPLNGKGSEALRLFKHYIVNENGLGLEAVLVKSFNKI